MINDPAIPARSRNGLIAAAVLALAVLAGGCAQTSSARWAQTAPTVPQVERIESNGYVPADEPVASTSGGSTATAAP